MSLSLRRGAATIVAATLAAAVTLVVLPGSPPAHAATVHRVLFDDSQGRDRRQRRLDHQHQHAGPARPERQPDRPRPTGPAPCPPGASRCRRPAATASRRCRRAAITYGTGRRTGPVELRRPSCCPSPTSRSARRRRPPIMKFVQNGGGLFLISDHTGSDRNNDGIDSVGDRQRPDEQQQRRLHRPVRLLRRRRDISHDNAERDLDSSDPVLHGPFGTVTRQHHPDGTHPDPEAGRQPGVKGLVYRQPATPGGNTGPSSPPARFGSGRVAFWGDSSAIDDGTGQSGNTLYDGWNDPPAPTPPSPSTRPHGSPVRGTGGGGGEAAAPAPPPNCSATRASSPVAPHLDRHAAASSTNASERTRPHRLLQGLARRLRHRTHRHALPVGDHPVRLHHATLSFYLHVDTGGDHHQRTGTTR